ncbi:MAG: hypothetical protein N3C12_04030 [Candidatus Binatia bacterium]|nr:hypothetical protein [Candidatus Binatia bacterium]
MSSRPWLALELLNLLQLAKPPMRLLAASILTVVLLGPRGAGACAGDCDGNGAVTIDEIVTGVRIALGSDVLLCPAADRDQNGIVSVDEIVAAVLAALEGCSQSSGYTFRELQERIFKPSCAHSGCHSAHAPVAGLDLESQHAWAQLVGAAPTNFAASLRGLRRVQPRDLEMSFLWVKLEPVVPPEYGSPMPLGLPPLSKQERRAIAQWILDGAAP